MRNRLARSDKERQMAKRMWLQGVPRREIADILQIPEKTLHDWRTRLDWPARRRYHSRPVVRKAKRKGIHHVKGTQLLAARVFACPTCCFRSTDPAGHESCKEAA